MTLNLHLEPKLDSALRRKAHEQGLTVESFVSSVLTWFVAGPVSVSKVARGEISVEELLRLHAEDPETRALAMSASAAPVDIDHEIESDPE